MRYVKKSGSPHNQQHQPTMCTSDLCRVAAQRLLSDLDWDPENVDALVLVTQTPDYHLPASSCVLHADLQLAPHCAAFDINMGCSGFVYGLSVLSSLVENGLSETGTATRRRHDQQDRIADMIPQLPCSLAMQDLLLRWSLIRRRLQCDLIWGPMGVDSNT